MYQLIIVEDDENIRQGLCNLFPWEDINYHIAGDFSNGKDAFDFILKNSVDAVLTDIRLPIMSGIELAQSIYERKLDIHIIFLTAYRDFEYAQMAVKYDVKDFLLKPVKYNELLMSFLKLKESFEQKISNNAPNPRKINADISSNSYYDRIISNVKKYITNNVKNANLDDAAIHVNLSNSYLSRLFKEKTGITFTEYVTKIRMEQAGHLLYSTDYKTYEIADIVGYDNPKNFSRAFKQFYNLTPREFREKGINI